MSYDTLPQFGTAPLDRFLGVVVEGRYSLDEIIGTGAMGVVYKGTQLAVDRPIAMKLLLPELQSDADFRQRFEREAKAVAMLRHPSCVGLYDFGYAPELKVFYIAMEYVEGEDLQAALPRLDTEEKLSVLLQISAGLEHAHGRGLIHRDLKPANIMLVRDDQGAAHIRILDFGLAGLVEVDADKRLTQVGQIFGTPEYMSPEQCSGELGITPASDLYSLGIIIFEAFEGDPPFTGKHINSLLMKHTFDAPPPITAEACPPSVRELVGKLLAKEADARPSGAEVRAVLEETLAGMRGEQVASAGIRSAAVVGAVLVLAGIVGIAISLNEPIQPDPFVPQPDPSVPTAGVQAADAGSGAPDSQADVVAEPDQLKRARPSKPKKRREEGAAKKRSGKVKPTSTAKPAKLEFTY